MAGSIPTGPTRNGEARMIRQFISNTWYGIKYFTHRLITGFPHDCHEWGISFGTEERGFVICDKCDVVLYLYDHKEKQAVKKRVYLSDRFRPMIIADAHNKLVSNSKSSKENK